MTSPLTRDRAELTDLLRATVERAAAFLDGLDERPAGHAVPLIAPLGLPDTGLGASGALEEFQQRYGTFISGSAGPRYFAFVTGGTTPAALVGDWLTSTFDQNGSDAGESSGRAITLDALGMFRDLLGLPETFDGVFVSGATTSSTVALATARQWVGRARNVDVSNEGVHALGPVTVLSGTAHSSIGKALSVIGLGRTALKAVSRLPEREAMDVAALASILEEIERTGSGPAIVVANAATVNTCDFDDLRAIGGLRERFNFWLHVDAAFGGVAAASPRFRPLLDGLELADSVTVDAHKWLNVPYDSAVVFTRHLQLQGEVFRNASAYLPVEVRPDTFLHLTPENSQRLRALPTWMTLTAYGRTGYAEIVERCCDLAFQLGEWIEEHPKFIRLAPVRLNGVCFTLADAEGKPRDSKAVADFLAALRDDGTAFLTPTNLHGTAAIRISISNWRTQLDDIEKTWEAMRRLAEFV